MKNIVTIDSFISKMNSGLENLKHSIDPFYSNFKKILEHFCNKERKLNLKKKLKTFLEREKNIIIN